MDESTIDRPSGLSRRQFLRVLGVGGSAAALGLAAGCGPATRSDTRPAATATSAPAIVTNQRRGHIVAGFAEDWRTLDPHVNAIITGFTVHRHIYDPLLEWDNAGTLIPVLAESWRSLDERTWEFTLRQGVRFHTGEEFTADSVKYSIERIFDPDLASNQTVFWDPIDSIEIKDKYVVVVRTKEPFGPLLAVLTITGMVPPGAGDSAGYFDGQPAGTGPFRVERHEPGQRLELSANGDYWRADEVQVEALTFRFIQETSTRVASLLSGEIHFADRIPPDTIQQIESDSRLGIISSRSVEAQYIGFNCSKEPFTDVRVRQAFNYAIDKQKIIDDLLLGSGTVANAPIAPDVFGHAAQQPYAPDLEKAKSLVAEAGYGSGLPDLELIVLKGVYTKGLEVAEAIAGQLKEIGANISVNDMEPALHWPARRDGEFEVAFVGWSIMTRDADFGLYRNFHAGKGPETENWLRYRSEEADAALELGRLSIDQDKRKSAYADAQRVIWNDAPWLWLYFTQINDAVDKRLTGVEQLPNHVKLFRKATITT